MLNTNNKIMTRKFPNTQKLYNKHLNNPLIKNEITMKIKKYFYFNNEVPTLTVSPLKQERYNISKNAQGEIYSLKCIYQTRKDQNQ